MKVGQLVAGRYELEELVGVGGMSSVYRAHDRVLERSVALKILHEHHGADAEYVERFRREAQAIARLSHPNIVTVIDRGEDGGRQYIVFEHIDGENLKQLVERTGPLPVGHALELAHQAARGLAFAHEVGIVHRDVKPHNVLVDQDGVAKVTDFGIARSLEQEDTLTQAGTMLGTSDYIAPEQVGGRRADERSDQYSLGVLLYELLTGAVPFPGDSFMAVAMRHVNDPVPSVRSRRPDVSPRVEEILARAMAKRPEDRFPTMEALIAALEAALAEDERPDSPPTPALESTQSLPAYQPPSTPRAPRPRSALPLLLVLAAAAAAGILAAILLGGGDGANGGGDGGPAAAGAGAAGAQPVRLRALADFDPFGDDEEHPEAIAAATDGDPATYWTTEGYRSFNKEGVGLVLDAGRPVALGRIAVTSDLPGFTAGIRASAQPDDGFVDVSPPRAAGPRTTFPVDTGGEEYRYYLLWITDPNERAHVNEVTAR
jgi:serine/threonine-protein kinase